MKKKEVKLLRWNLRQRRRGGGVWGRGGRTRRRPREEGRRRKERKGGKGGKREAVEWSYTETIRIVEWCATVQERQYIWICCYRQISKTTEKGEIRTVVKKKKKTILNSLKKRERKYPPILEECRIVLKTGCHSSTSPIFNISTGYQLVSDK